MDILFGLNNTAEIEIVLQDEDTRTKLDAIIDKEKCQLPLYFDGETVSGKVLPT